MFFLFKTVVRATAKVRHVKPTPAPQPHVTREKKKIQKNLRVKGRLDERDNVSPMQEMANRWMEK